MNNRLVQRTIDIAMALCPLNLEKRCSHIAFLIKKGKIVHIGMNNAKSHPEIVKYNYDEFQSGIHAELNVCMKSGKENLRNYKMVVLRVNRKNKLSDSKPCIGCQHVIRQFDVGEVWYSDSNGNIVALK